MNIKLKVKALGLVVLAAGVVSAFAVMQATAKTGGHFVSETTHTIVNQTSAAGSLHQLEFFLGTSEVGIICDKMTATGTAATQTVTEEVGNISLSNCHTTGSEVQTAIHLNGCQTRITIAPGNAETTEQTNDLICPAGKAVEITHPNCTVKIPPQTFTGLTYKTTVDATNKHTLTVVANSSVTIYYEAGICVFVGTNQIGVFKGSTIVRAENTLGERVGITAT
ncbi:MAG TPA: hypothetical protein VGB06_10100 [Solirubrobacterales bacterium]|jgi:hypothetical protein